MKRTTLILVSLALAPAAWLAGCSTDDSGDGPRRASRTLTTEEIAQMCLDLCREASYCGLLDDVGGIACEAQCAEALMAQEYDTVAAWSCAEWAGAPDRCDALVACLDSVPTNASCARGCAAFDACGAYPYFGRMGSLNEMPPIEAVCARWCDGQVAFDRNGELEGHVACYASALANACDAYDLLACEREPPDCETACAFVDTCSAEVPGAFASSAACEAHCDGLDGGAQWAFASCVSSARDCDPAVDPWCGGCADTTECELLPQRPSRSCLRACNAAIALCDPGDRIGVQLCAWECTMAETERVGLGDELAICIEAQETCPQTDVVGNGAGRWGAIVNRCWGEIE